MIRDHASKPGVSKKLQPRYKGPYVIAAILDKNRYKITDVPGFSHTQKPYDSILSPDRLKHWVKPLNKVS